MENSLPGMAEDTVLDTAIDEPSMTPGEVDMLLFAPLAKRSGDEPVGEDPPQP